MFGITFEHFSRPLVLLTALPVACFILVRGFTARRRFVFGLWIVATLLRLVIAGGLIYLLAGPEQMEKTTRAGRLEIILDRSRSLSSVEKKDQTDGAFLLIQKALALRTPPNVVIAGFAKGGRIVFFGAAEPALKAREKIERDLLALESDGGDLSSDLDQALHELADLKDEGPIVRHIFSDGAIDLPKRSIYPAAATFFHPSAATPRIDLSASALRLPASVEEGEKTVMKLTVNSPAATKTKYAIFVDGVERPGGEIALAKGTSETELTLPDPPLSAGAHEILCRILPGDAEPENDLAGGVVFVRPRREFLLVGVDGPVVDDAVSRALMAEQLPVHRAQIMDLRTIDAARTAAVLLDRIPAKAVTAAQTEALEAYVRGGGGLFVIPRDDDDEALRWTESPIGPLLPLVGKKAPPAPPPPEPKMDEAPNAKKLEDPDAAKSKIEKIDAPTLAMLIVIDKSESMGEDGSLDAAKRGAIATARELHPDDKVGVVAFNQEPTEIVPMQPAGNLPAIERAIQRLGAGGATDIKKALEFGRETLLRETAAVKVIVLLSDGMTIRFNEEKTAASLKKDGIAVMTVGIGQNFDLATLSLISLYSGGTGPIPARTPRDIPKVLVDVATEVMKKNKTRTAKDQAPKKPADPTIKRPEDIVAKDAAKPAPADAAAKKNEDAAIGLEVERPVVFLTGIDWSLAPKIKGTHPSQATKDAWVSLRTTDKEPFLAHRAVGDGIVLMCAAPLEGRWTNGLAAWDAYSTWLTQAVRFIARPERDRRFETEGVVDERHLLLKLADRMARDASEDAEGWSVVDGRSKKKLAMLALGEGRFVVSAADAFAGPFARIDISRVFSSGTHTESSSFFVPPLPEIRERGTDLERFAPWAGALGAAVALKTDFDGALPKASEIVVHRSTGERWVWVLAAVFAIDLLLKRFGRRSTAALEYAS